MLLSGVSSLFSDRNRLCKQPAVRVMRRISLIDYAAPGRDFKPTLKPLYIPLEANGIRIRPARINQRHRGYQLLYDHQQNSLLYGSAAVASGRLLAQSGSLFPPKEQCRLALTCCRPHRNHLVKHTLVHATFGRRLLTGRTRTR